MPGADWRDLLNFNPVAGSHANDAVATVTTLTPPANLYATKLLIQAVGNPVRMTLEGTDPVAGSVGFLITVDLPMVVAKQSNTVFKFLSDTGTLEYEWGM